MVVGGPDQAYALYDDDPRVGVEHRCSTFRAPRRVARVVLLILPAVTFYALPDSRFEVFCSLFLEVEVYPERLDLGPHQVIRTCCSYLGEFFGVAPADELEDVFRGVIEAQNLVGHLQLAGLWGFSAP